MHFIKPWQAAHRLADKGLTPWIRTGKSPRSDNYTDCYTWTIET